MKRPLEFLTAGLVLGELTVYAGSSNPAGGLCLTACFVCLIFLSFRAMRAAAGRSVPHAFSVLPSDSSVKRKLFPILWNAENCIFRYLKCHFSLPAQRGAIRLGALLLAVGFFLGALRLGISCIPSRESRLLDQKLDAAGDSGRVTLDLAIESLDINPEKERRSARCGNVLVTIPDEASDAALCSGNRIRVSGKLSRPSGARNPGQFDYASYLRAQRITHLLYADRVSVLNPRALPLRSALEEIRNAGIEVLRQNLPPDDAAFLRASLFGDRSGLDGDFYDMYRRNGIAHLLAISGLHMALIGMGLYRALRKCGAGFGLSGAVSGIFLVLYSSLAGSGTGLIRAVLMMLLAFTASFIGRTYDLRSAACAAALIILLGSPLELFQCGFQLSFLAILSIGGPGKAAEDALGRWAAAPHTESALRRRKKTAAFLTPLLVSASVTLCSLPVTAFWFYSVPLWSVLLNLLVIPLMAYVLSSGIALLGTKGLLTALSASATLPASSAAPAAAISCTSAVSVSPALLPLRLLSFTLLTEAGIVHRILELYTILCRFAERLPYHRILIGRPAYWQIALYYLLLFGSLHLLFRRKQPGFLSKTAPRFLTLVLLLASLLALRPVRSRNLILWFLDVGQGDAIVLERGSSFVLIDGGSSSEKSCGQYILRPFLESRAASRLDAVFLTHPDMDHTNGAEYLFTEDSDLEIRSVILNAVAETDEENYGDLKRAALSRPAGTSPPALRYLGAGEHMGILTCLSPQRGKRYADRNEESLILLLESGGKRCLLMGDADAANETDLLSLASSPYGVSLHLPERLSGIDVLKAGHHGSKTSTSQAFLDLVSPRTAILSYGRGNRYGHPHKETVTRLENAGASIRRTAEEGAVRIDWKP